LETKKGGEINQFAQAYRMGENGKAVAGNNNSLNGHKIEMVEVMLTFFLN